MGLAGIGVHNSRGVAIVKNHNKKKRRVVLANVGILASNEVEVLATLEAHHIFVAHYHVSLAAESDLVNAVHWVSFPLEV